jgi:hypothetical protein
MASNTNAPLKSNSAMATPAATGPNTMASSSVSDTSAFVRARCSSATRRGGIDWRAGIENAKPMPCNADSSASDVKSSAASSSSDATMPSTLVPARVAFGPMRSISVPVSGPSSTDGSEKASPNSATWAGDASYSNFA